MVIDVLSVQRRPQSWQRQLPIILPLCQNPVRRRCPTPVGPGAAATLPRTGLEFARPAEMLYAEKSLDEKPGHDRD